MFDTSSLLAPRILRSFIPTYDNNINHWRQISDDNEDMAAVMPGKPSSIGRPRLFTPLQAALVAIMADFLAVDIKTPLAAKIARRVMEGHFAQPDVEQWVIMVAANGNVSTLPYHQIDLRTGFISGARLSFALVVDLKTYADRVAVAIADAPKVIGGGDEE